MPALNRNIMKHHHLAHLVTSRSSRVRKLWRRSRLLLRSKMPSNPPWTSRLEVILDTTQMVKICKHWISKGDGTSIKSHFYQVFQSFLFDALESLENETHSNEVMGENFRHRRPQISVIFLRTPHNFCGVCPWRNNIGVREDSSFYHFTDLDDFPSRVWWPDGTQVENPEVFEHERVREPRIIGGLKLWFLGWSQNSEWAPLSTINQVGLSVERSKEALGCTWCFLGPQAWTYVFHTARGVDPWLN